MTTNDGSLEGVVESFNRDGALVRIGRETGVISARSFKKEHLRKQDAVKVRRAGEREGQLHLSLVELLRPTWWTFGETFLAGEGADPKLVAEFAPKLAEDIASRGMSPNALRNFYDAVKSIDAPILQAGTRALKTAAFNRQLPLIKLLSAKAAHKSRENPQFFNDFLNRGVQVSESLREFQGFVLVFEAVTGWHTKYAKQGGN
ncbi:MAG: type III-A CRISPR-associated protein Csm2 [Blastocatellia bacterium]